MQNDRGIVECKNSSDAVPLYLPQQLYLKPSATICISVQLSPKTTGKTIVHGEMIQKLKALIAPDVFAGVKVTRSAVDVVRFEAELELAAYIQRVLGKLDNKFIKLKDIAQLLKVRACEAKSDFPTRHEWDAYFRDAKDMNEMKFGERPDTVHVSNLPTAWFVSEKHLQRRDESARGEENLLPSEKLFYYAFEKFGDIRHVDVPVCDPYRCKMKPHISGFQNSSVEDTQFFEGYVQFKEYVGFVECMNALRGKRLLRKDRLGEPETVKIFVTFDKTKHLTEGAIRRRDILRERLILKQKSREDVEREKREEVLRKITEEKQKTEEFKNQKEQRRRDREEKRKAKILAQLKSQENSEFSEKIAKEEKKLIKVQRKLEAIRLVEELFKRLEGKLDLRQKSKSACQEDSNNQLERLRVDSEQEYTSQRDRLTKAVQGRVILRSIVSSTAKEVCSEEETSSEDSIGNPARDAEKVYPSHPINAWYPYWQTPLMAAAAYGAVAPPAFYEGAGARGYYFPARGGRGRGQHGQGTSGGRQFRGRGRGYRSYRTSKFSAERYTRSRSRDRSYSRHRDSRSRSRTRSPSESRYSRSRRRRRSSYSRSRSRSKTRSKSRSGTRSRSRSRGKDKSKSRSRSRS